MENGRLVFIGHIPGNVHQVHEDFSCYHHATSDGRSCIVNHTCLLLQQAVRMSTRVAVPNLFRTLSLRDPDGESAERPSSRISDSGLDQYDPSEGVSFP